MFFAFRFCLSRLWFATRVNNGLYVGLRDRLRTEHDVTFCALELRIGLSRLHFEIHRAAVIDALLNSTASVPSFSRTKLCPMIAFGAVSLWPAVLMLVTGLGLAAHGAVTLAPRLRRSR